MCGSVIVTSGGGGFVPLLWLKMHRLFKLPPWPKNEAMFFPGTFLTCTFPFDRLFKCEHQRRTSDHLCWGSRSENWSTAEEKPLEGWQSSLCVSPLCCCSSRWLKAVSMTSEVSFCLRLIDWKKFLPKYIHYLPLTQFTCSVVNLSIMLL